MKATGSWQLVAGFRGKMMILPVIGLTCKLRLAASNWRQAVRGKILNLQVIVYYLYNQTSYAFNFMESKTIFYTSQPLAASCQLLSIKEPEL